MDFGNLMNPDVGNLVGSTKGDLIGSTMLGMGLMTGMAIAVAVVVGLILYIYLALALSTMGKKLKVEPTWLAWIPIINLFYIPMLAGYKWYYGFLWLLAIVPFLGYIVPIIIFWWSWKIAKRRGFPPWISLFLFTPGAIILPAVIAWYDEKKI